MYCKKHGQVGGFGFSVYPADIGPVITSLGDTRLLGSVMISGPDLSNEQALPKEYQDACSFAKIFCVQCVAEILEKLGATCIGGVNNKEIITGEIDLRPYSPVTIDVEKK